MLMILIAGFVVVNSGNGYDNPLELSIVQCETDSRLYSFYSDLVQRVEVFDMNNRRMEISISNGQKVFEFNLKGLSTGKYKLRYENLFGQEIDTLINVSEKTAPLKLCVDKLKPYEILTFVDEMRENGNSWILSFESIGCFHKYENKFVVSKRDGEYFLWYEIGGPNLENSFCDEKRLNRMEIDALREFECKLRILKNDLYILSSTTNTYLIGNQNQTYQVVDHACQWSGVNELINKMKINVR